MSPTRGATRPASTPGSNWGNVPISEIPRLQKEGKLKLYPLLATYFYCFNVTRPPFDDARVRRAFTLALNRAGIVESVTRGGQVPALAWVPYGLADARAEITVSPRLTVKERPVTAWMTPSSVLKFTVRSLMSRRKSVMVYPCFILTPAANSAGDQRRFSPLPR